MAEGIHAVSGRCDLCGDVCDAEREELNVLTCTFKGCHEEPYHQECLEKYLKAIKCERNRKTGFKCPRGWGKNTPFKDQCPGKIDKSHPIHPRSEDSKRRKKAKMPEMVAPPPRPAKKEKEVKEEKKAVKEEKKAVKAVDVKPAGKVGAVPLVSKAPVPQASKVAAKAAGSAPLEDRQRLAEAVAAARRELGGSRSSSGGVVGAASSSSVAAVGPKELRTLDAYLAAQEREVAPHTAPNAWAVKPPVGAVVPHAVAGRKASGPAVTATSRAPTAACSSAMSPFAPLASEAAFVDGGRPGSSGAAAAPTATAGATTPPASTSRASSFGSAWGMSNAAAAHAPLAAGPVGTHSFPVGMDLVDSSGGAALGDSEEPKLTRAQKKNLKRAEKKARKGAPADEDDHHAEDAGSMAGDGSCQGDHPPMAPMHADLVSGREFASSGTCVVSASTSRADIAQLVTETACKSTSAPIRDVGIVPGIRRALPAASVTAVEVAHADACTASPAANDADAVMLELASEALIAHRALDLMQQLQRLGFESWQAAAAVQQWGSDLIGGIAWLLEGGAGASPLAVLASSQSGAAGEVDVDDDIATLGALAQALGVGAAEGGIGPAALYHALIQAGGDLAVAAQDLANSMGMTAGQLDAQLQAACARPFIGSGARGHAAGNYMGADAGHDAVEACSSNRTTAGIQYPMSSADFSPAAVAPTSMAWCATYRGEGQDDVLPTAEADVPASSFPMAHGGGARLDPHGNLLSATSPMPASSVMGGNFAAHSVGDGTLQLQDGLARLGLGPRAVGPMTSFGIVQDGVRTSGPGAAFGGSAPWLTGRADGQLSSRLDVRDAGTTTHSLDPANFVGTAALLQGTPGAVSSMPSPHMPADFTWGTGLGALARPSAAAGPGGSQPLVGVSRLFSAYAAPVTGGTTDMHSSAAAMSGGRDVFGGHAPPLCMFLNGMLADGSAAAGLVNAAVPGESGDGDDGDLEGLMATLMMAH